MSTRSAAVTTLAVVAVASLAACSEPVTLVGDWAEVNPITEPGVSRSRVTFRDDGTFLLVDGGSHGGTYTQNQDLVAMTPVSPFGSGLAALHRIALTDTTLMLDAATPVGEADGFVATWRTEWWSGGDRYLRVLRLDADGTAESEETRYPSGSVSQASTLRDVGRWQALADDQVEAHYDGLTLPRYYFLVDGHLSTRLYARY